MSIKRFKSYYLISCYREHLHSLNFVRGFVISYLQLVTVYKLVCYTDQSVSLLLATCNLLLFIN